ncbi:MAG: DUF2141 domain-containing protein [Xanthomonadaceae bacterium]|nr:DUF2141 domain-containing protein [Xanthomonadaceae bacterium]
MKTIILALLLIQPSFANKTEIPTLILHVKNIKKVVPEEGKEKVDQLLISLFDQEEGFPSKPDLAKDKRVIKVTGTEMDIEFTGLSEKDHAVAVIHDENANGKVDMKKALFIPVGLAEGYAASNDAKGSMGPPKFNDAKFAFKAPKTEITVTLEY